jgi:hypothetical protein
MSVMRFTLFFALVLVSSACTTPKTSIRSMEGYEKIVTRQQNFVSLPAVVEVNMVGAGGSKERMYDYEHHLEGIIRKELVLAMKEKGYTLKVLSRKDIHNQKLSRNVIELRGKYEEHLAEMYKELLLPEEEAFKMKRNIGRRATELANELAKKTDEEVFLLFDYRRDVQTDGARIQGFAMTLLLGRAQIVESAAIYVALIDAKTGNILWVETEREYKGLMSDMFSSQDEVDREQAIRMVKGLLKSFPARGAPVEASTNSHK